MMTNENDEGLTPDELEVREQQTRAGDRQLRGLLIERGLLTPEGARGDAAGAGLPCLLLLDGQRPGRAA
jgi:hypothetical protein